MFIGTFSSVSPTFSMDIALIKNCEWLLLTKALIVKKLSKFEMKGVISNIKEFFIIHDQYKQHIYKSEHFKKSGGFNEEYK